MPAQAPDIDTMIAALRGQGVQNPAFIKVAEILELLNGQIGSLPGSPNEEIGICIYYDEDATYEIPEGVVLKYIAPFYGSAGSMRISVVDMGADDIFVNEAILEGWNQPIVLNHFASEGPKNIMFAGVTAGSRITFVQEKIKRA